MTAETGRSPRSKPFETMSFVKLGLCDARIGVISCLSGTSTRESVRNSIGQLECWLRFGPEHDCKTDCRYLQTLTLNPRTLKNPGSTSIDRTDQVHHTRKPVHHSHAAQRAEISSRPVHEDWLQMVQSSIAPNQQPRGWILRVRLMLISWMPREISSTLFLVCRARSDDLHNVEQTSTLLEQRTWQKWRLITIHIVGTKD